MRDEVNPLLILGHRDGAVAELFDHAVRAVGLALENSCVCVVCLLYLADDDRFELTARALEVQVGLDTVRPDFMTTGYI